MTTRHLQLRVHSLECIHITDNRQNVLGVSLENDPDSPIRLFAARPPRR